jgi:hypothetical protein
MHDSCYFGMKQQSEYCKRLGFTLYYFKSAIPLLQKTVTLFPCTCSWLLLLVNFYYRLSSEQSLLIYMQLMVKILHVKITWQYSDVTSPVLRMTWLLIP